MQPKRWPGGLFILITLFGIAADQISKAWALATLRPIGSISVLPGFLNLTFVRNTGIAFGLFAGQGWLVALLMLALGIFALFQARSLDWRRREPNIVGGLLLAGAAGNLLDRARLGYVVDFLDAHLGPHHWPVFNVADSLICLAVGWIVVRQFFPDASAEPARRP